jgi:outer membrane protein assembly factor BamB
MQTWKETLFFWEDEEEQISEKKDSTAPLSDIKRVTLPTDESALLGNVLPDTAPVTTLWQEAGEAAHYSGHIAGSSLTKSAKTVTVGEGNAWRKGAIPPSIVANEHIVVAMDGYGYISAHARRDINTVLWEYEGIASEDALLTGGLAMNADTVYGITSQGDIAAISTKNGTQQWILHVKEAVRSSLRLAHGLLFFVTADGQLFAVNAKDGALLWNHRSVGQVSGLFGTALPVVSDPFVITAFPSGELISVIMRSGEVLWNDTLYATNAASKQQDFGGIDANPIISDNMLIAGNVTSMVSAFDARDGRKLWELPVGLQHEPWLAGNGLFLISDTHELIAAHRYRGVVAWHVALPASEENVFYYGPYLVDGKLLVLSSSGDVSAYSPDHGKKLWIKSLGETIVTRPSFQGKAAYVMTEDATLLELY